MLAATIRTIGESSGPRTASSRSITAFRKRLAGSSFQASSMLVLAAAALVGGGDVVAQDLEPSRIDVSALGPQVGEIVPDFNLPDQHGELWTRESIMGENGAMLVFIRSADW